MRALIFMIYELFCLVMVKVISQSVGHSDLAMTYSDVLSSDIGGSKAVQLIDISVRLDKLSFPDNQIVEAWKAFKGNVLCQSLLRRLVALHFYIYPVRQNVKQRVCAKLGISLLPPIPAK